MNNDFISTASLYDSNYLAHYGIKGQKWGIRRFQNPDGSLTAEGAKRYGSLSEMKKAAREEYRKDQKVAKAMGNTAASSAYAYKIQKKAYEKAEKRYQKKPTNENLRKLDIEAISMHALKNVKDDRQEKAEKHYKSLVDKYGSQAIKDIKYGRDGLISEKNGATAWNILAGIAAGASIMATGVAIVPVFESNKDVGRRLRAETRARTKKTYNALFGDRAPSQAEAADFVKQYNNR